MSDSAFLDRLASDGAALLAAARAAGPDRPVPTCPGWSVRDLVEHTAEVYRHKALTVSERATKAPRSGYQEPLRPDLFDDLQASLDRVLDVLRAHEPDEPVWTWYPPRQDVGFWRRRMCQETVIHRADAEVAATGSIEPVPDWLAIDGIDELLVCFLDDDWSEEPTGEDTWTVAVRHADRQWWALVEPLKVTVSTAPPTGAGPPDVTVSAGTASDLLLGLWHRLPRSVLTESGDEKLRTRLHEMLVTAE